MHVVCVLNFSLSFRSLASDGTRYVDSEIFLGHVLSKAPCRRLVDFVLVWEEKPKVKRGMEIFHFL